MICTHPDSNNHVCFPSMNGWKRPCNECPKEEEVQTWMNTPEQQAISKQANVVLDALLKDKS